MPDTIELAGVTLPVLARSEAGGRVVIPIENGWNAHVCSSIPFDFHTTPQRVGFLQHWHVCFITRSEVEKAIKIDLALVRENVDVDVAYRPACVNALDARTVYEALLEAARQPSP